MILFNREQYIATRREVKTMLNPVPTTKAGPNLVPKVLLQAKKEATLQASRKKNSSKGHFDKGHWDDGHWANRK